MNFLYTQVINFFYSVYSNLCNDDGTLGISTSIIVQDFCLEDESLAQADPSFAEEKKT